ncbi:glycosyltransferase [Canibacter oris]|uniref:Glycosyltransferase involved in cell wall biosynthesis n=1 Tax=Canibacter oris TaxID=1365628 RepID=A0A840DID3_9MICO|nr:glycosyltransferase [Canibacter oris]MBB4071483.1 glycosyltransferase involved in cell wall biosynthesis [Canibacter oris]
MSAAVTITNTQTAPFSLLLPVYAGDTAAQLSAALESCLVQQTLKPAEIIVVQDGPVPPAITAVLEQWRASLSPVPLRVLQIAQNKGLANALNYGLQHCGYEVVARMDADDISLPERFAKQWQRFNDGQLDVLGTAMEEFADDSLQTVSLRMAPAGAARIRQHAITHSPFNHPTVMYRKATVLEHGGYREMGSMEDYWLFVRLIAAGAKVDNLREPLLRYRAGRGVYRRRGGMETAATELRLQREMLRIGFITPAQFIRNCVMKTVYRLLPVRIKQVLFKRFIAPGLPGDKK